MTFALSLPAKRSTAPKAKISSPGQIALSLLNWLAEKDRAYRDRLYLRSLTDQELRDVGLTRNDVP